MKTDIIHKYYIFICSSKFDTNVGNQILLFSNMVQKYRSSKIMLLTVAITIFPYYLVAVFNNAKLLFALCTNIQ